MTANLPPPLVAGELIDSRYRLVREIAAGGMGVVWEAEHVGLRKAVAVKLLHAQVADVPGITARFEREARSTSALDHPNIVRVTDFGRTPGGQHYLVLELLVGRSLSAVLDAEGAIEPNRAVALIDQLLAGLGAAHERHLVHRDLKPDNVFVVKNSQGREQVKILDFGIASLKGEQGNTKLTQTGAVMGTPAYMSPEQAMGLPEIDARSDLHAVGAILYELLSNHPAYDGENYHQVMHAILVGRTTPLETLRPGLPASLYATIARAMAGTVEERFPDAQAFRAALRGEAPAAATEVSPTAPALPHAATDFRLPAKLSTTDVGARRDRSEVGDSPSSASRAQASLEPVATAAPFVASALSGPEETRPRRDAAAFGHSDEPALELDRPTPAPNASPTSATGRRSRWLLLAPVLVLLVSGALLLPRLLAPANVTILLGAAPPGTRLTLEGEALLGERIVLPRSTRQRLLTIALPGRPPRQVAFVADRDQTLPLVQEGTPR